MGVLDNLIQLDPTNYVSEDPVPMRGSALPIPVPQHLRARVFSLSVEVDDCHYEGECCEDEEDKGFIVTTNNNRVGFKNSVPNFTPGRSLRCKRTLDDEEEYSFLSRRPAAIGSRQGHFRTINNNRGTPPGSSVWPPNSYAESGKAKYFRSIPTSSSSSSFGFQTLTVSPRVTDILETPRTHSPPKAAPLGSCPLGCSGSLGVECSCRNESSEINNSQSLEEGDSFVSGAGTPVKQPPRAPERRRARSESLQDSKMLYILRAPTPSASQSSDNIEVMLPFQHEETLEILETIGSGDQSVVELARHRVTSKLYAIKKSRRQFRGANDRQKMLQEIKLVAALPASRNIVQYYRAWQSEGLLYTQMEYCHLGTLRSSIQGWNGKPPREMVKGFMRDILSGLDVVHSHQLMHMDLKPENVFVASDGTLKIGDFGMAASIDNWHGDEGDRVYLAPEVLYDNNATTAADIFSAGLVMYEMITGMSLPKSGEEWQNLRKGTLSFPQNSLEQDCAEKLIYELCAPEFSARPSAAAALKSNFFL